MFSVLRLSLLRFNFANIAGRNFSGSNCFRMELKDVVTSLEGFAPTSLAEKWDNVGLLVEPTGKHEVQSILLTNDLTEKVLEEAIEKKVQMIVSYHPPIFVPLKKLTCKSFKERIIVKSIEHKIAIYSPHTAFDAVHNGVNDWLATGLGKATVVPLKHSMETSTKGCTNKVTLSTHALISGEDAVKMHELMHKVAHVVDFTVEKKTSNNDEVYNSVSWCCSENTLLPSLAIIKNKFSISSLAVQPLAKVPLPMTGSGRLCTLATPVTLEELIKLIKHHLNLQHLRVAHSTSTNKVTTIALCAGSGGSVLKGAKADVFLTGEMSHHEVLEAVANGSHVILCEHSNTERGFLNVFKEKLYFLLNGQVDVIVSTTDADPLTVV